MAHETVNFRGKNHGLWKSFQSFSSLLQITKLHNTAINLLYKIQKNFIWQGKKTKIKHSILCNGYENGSIKNVDLRNKTSM